MFPVVHDKTCSWLQLRGGTIAQADRNQSSKGTQVRGAPMRKLMMLMARCSRRRSQEKGGDCQQSATSRGIKNAQAAVRSVPVYMIVTMPM